MLWSRPENRQFAGKLLIAGGNAQGFASPAAAYNEAIKAGIGTSRVLLPDALSRTVGKLFDAAEFAPSTPSGSFGQKALLELLSLGNWADGVLLDGDLGRNSETAILLEKFLNKHTGGVTLTGDAVENVLQSAPALIARPQTLLVIDFVMLQRLFMAAHYPQAITSDMDLLRFVDVLHNFTMQHNVFIITRHLDTTVVAAEGAVSTTAISGKAHWQTKTAAHAAVWWLQNPSKPFDALTTSIVD